jgi:ElaB/YqjD/DUF883 family membrane-anchored ribosome-binding protein
VHVNDLDWPSLFIGMGIGVLIGALILTFV